MAPGRDRDRFEPTARVRAEPSRDRALRLDAERRQALHELIALLAGMVSEAHSLTSAALRADRALLAQASASLREMAAAPVLDLARMTEIYAAVRRAVVDGQPSQVPAPEPGHGLMPEPGRTGDSLDTRESRAAVAEAEAILSRMLVQGARVVNRSGPGSPLAELGQEVPPTSPRLGIRWPSPA